MNTGRALIILLAIGAFVASLTIHVLQADFYARDYERIVYGAYGVIWFIVLFRLSRKLDSGLDSLLISLLAAAGLGFTPHRLRLAFFEDRSPDVIYSSGGEVFFVVLFPLAHFTLTLLFLIACRSIRQSKISEDERP